MRVVFSPRVARYIRERLWHPSQRFRDLADGRLEMTLRVADTLEARRWILGYGTDAEVAEPDGLREALRQEAESLARMLVPGRRPLAAVAPGRGRKAGAGRPGPRPAVPLLLALQGLANERLHLGLQSCNQKIR